MTKEQLSKKYAKYYTAASHILGSLLVAVKPDILSLNPAKETDRAKINNIIDSCCGLSILAAHRLENNIPGNVQALFKKELEKKDKE